MGTSLGFAGCLSVDGWADTADVALDVVAGRAGTVTTAVTGGGVRVRDVESFSLAKEPCAVTAESGETILCRDTLELSLVAGGSAASRAPLLSSMR
jgi:hypothetical protein